MEELTQVIKEQYGLVPAGIFGILCLLFGAVLESFRQTWVHKQKKEIDSVADKQAELDGLTKNLSVEQRDLLLAMGGNPTRMAKVNLSTLLEQRGVSGDGAIELIHHKVDLTFPHKPYFEALTNLRDRFYLDSKTHSRFDFNAKGVQTAERLVALGFSISSNAKYLT